MRALLYSDVHLEFGSFKHPCKSSAETYYDIVLLAGDISKGNSGIAWAGQNFTYPYYVAGNHEFYGRRDINEHYDEMREAAQKHGVAFLQNDVAYGHLDYDGVASEKYRVIGATLWTDFALDKDQILGLAIGRQSMNDYYEIMDKKWHKDNQRGWESSVYHFFTPESALERHKESLAFIISELEKPFDGKTIVMTHHAPSGKSINRKYLGSEMNHLYSSNLDRLIEAFQPDLWVHGHCHSTNEYEIGKTKIRSNPRGYVGYGKGPGNCENNDFKIDYIVDF